MLKSLLAIAMALTFAATEAKNERTREPRAAFMKIEPCPVTGKSYGACPGYVVDHVKPLCADGPDHPSNMQWQTVMDAKTKDLLEARQCRAMRRDRH